MRITDSIYATGDWVVLKNKSVGQINAVVIDSKVKVVVK